MLSTDDDNNFSKKLSEVHFLFSVVALLVLLYTLANVCNIIFSINCFGLLVIYAVDALSLLLAA